MPQWYLDLVAALAAATSPQQAVGFVLHQCSAVLRMQPNQFGEPLVTAIPLINRAAALCGHSAEVTYSETEQQPITQDIDPSLTATVTPQNDSQLAALTPTVAQTEDQ